MKINPRILAEIDHEMARRGWTMSELAGRIGVTAQAISLWTTGKTKTIKPSVWVKLVALAPACAVAAGVARPAPVIPFTPPACPLSDCPAKGIPHEPDTNMLLDIWMRLDKDSRMDFLKDGMKLVSREPRRVGESTPR